MGFVLLLLVTATLFIRPSDFLPQLAAVQLYLILIVPCLAFSAGSLLAQFTGEALTKRPITLCVLWLLPATILTNLAHFRFAALGDFCVEFGKALLLYLLIVGLVYSPGRLKTMMGGIVVSIAVVTSLAVLHYHGYVNFPALDAMEDGGEWDPVAGDFVAHRRLRGPGLFHDPNDMSAIICIGIMLCLCGVGDRRQGLLRFLWVVPAPLLGYGLALTGSRGGFLAFVAGLLVLFVARYRARRAVFLAAAALPVVLALFRGRMTDISGGTSEGTGQSRIQLWLDGFALFFHAPLFGIGTGQFEANMDHVAHNAYVHIATELGLFGAIPFIGIVYYGLWALFRLGGAGVPIADPELRRMRPYLAATWTTYAVSMFSLSLCYYVSTYSIFGLAGAYLRMATPDPPPPGSELDERLALRMVAVAVGVLAATFLFAKFNVRYT